MIGGEVVSSWFVLEPVLNRANDSCTGDLRRGVAPQQAACWPTPGKASNLAVLPEQVYLPGHPAVHLPHAVPGLRQVDELLLRRLRQTTLHQGVCKVSCWFSWQSNNCAHPRVRPSTSHVGPHEACGDILGHAARDWRGTAAAQTCALPLPAVACTRAAAATACLAALSRWSSALLNACGQPQDSDVRALGRAHWVMHCLLHLYITVLCPHPVPATSP